MTIRTVELVTEEDSTDPETTRAAPRESQRGQSRRFWLTVAVMALSLGLAMGWYTACVMSGGCLP